MHTKINWFEIPAADFARAVKFYEAIFATPLRVEAFGDTQLGVFTVESGDSIGAVIDGSNYVPGTNGPVLYLEAQPSIDTVLERIEPAGGSIKMGKFALPDGMGYIAHFLDTEGNRLALHSMT
ncbi:MAG: VOC family protein [Burkholderiales bacterium]|nr:VOC family protein [Burkholderiales bacterium]